MMINYLTFYMLIPYFVIKPLPLYCIENEDSTVSKIMWYPITWSEGIYTFRVYVEGKPLKEHKSKFSILKTVYVKVYSENSVFVSELVV